MNPGIPTAADSSVVVAQQLWWAESARSVLQAVAGFSVTVNAAMGAEAAEDANPPVWARFTAEQGLLGEFALLTDVAGAVQLAQVLMSETADPTAPYDDVHKEAFVELLRQIAGQVAVGLQAAAGAEVSLNLVAQDAPTWPEAGRFGVRISGEKLSGVRLVGTMSAELVEALNRAREAQEKKAENKTAPEPKTQNGQAAVAEPEAPAVASSSNLELLLDVKLNATIRFGQRRMLPVRFSKFIPARR